MNFPIDITIGNFRLPSHLLFEVLAYIFGFRYFLHLRERGVDPISEDNRIWIMIGGAFGALLFSRLFGVLETFSEWQRLGYSFLYVYGTKTILGGLFGGLLGVEIVKKVIGEKRSSGDLFTYPLILGIAVGRIGCFLTGVKDGTVGIESTLPWAMNLGDGVMRHPVSLYEILFLGLLVVFFGCVGRKGELREGYKFKTFLLLYALFRFLVEYIKPATDLYFGFTSIQVLFILILCYYSPSILYLVRNPKSIFANE